MCIHYSQRKVLYLDIPAEAAISSLLDAMMGSKLRANVYPLFAEEGCLHVLDLADSAGQMSFTLTQHVIEF
jgi:hypothetical protein